MRSFHDEESKDECARSEGEMKEESAILFVKDDKTRGITCRAL